MDQPARLNACFVVPNKGERRTEDENEPLWRPALEWETPIWGWVIINFADYGIQIFLSDGTPFRELRLDGANGKVTSPVWIPLHSPKKPSTMQFSETPENQQLALFVEALQRDEYCKQFVEMINNAVATLESTPSFVPEYLIATVGRPLALVNMSWSLELATDALKFPLASDEKPVTGDLQRTFNLKLGDQDRNVDGLIGYFNTKQDINGPPRIGDALDLNRIYSHFHFRSNVGTIGPSNFPSLEAFNISSEGLTPEAYEKQRNRELSKHIFGALVDPYTPVHGYAGILPVKELRFPAWTWQTAIGKMKAFYHTGPLIVASDVPDLNENREQRPKGRDDDVQDPEGGTGVPVPAISSSEWTWLQPYEESEGDSEDEHFKPLAVDEVKGDLSSRLGPHDALEGFLHT